MIRYDYSRADIEAAIRAATPRRRKEWLEDAQERTEKFIRNRTYEESSTIWGEIKSVYIQLQNQKCIFCERQFEHSDYGRIEYDVEHFRPKSSIKNWPPRRGGPTYNFPTGASANNGYYWLAYNVENYAASCKICNSTLKSNRFPVAGARGNAADTVRQLLREKPHLCYPIGRFDADPETLVTFVATTAIPAGTRGHRRNRGQVIIDFFKLNQRENLHRQRAKMLILLGNALKDLDDRVDIPINRSLVKGVTAPAMPHAACSRAYRKLWNADTQRARQVLNLCKQYLISPQGAQPPSQ